LQAQVAERARYGLQWEAETVCGPIEGSEDIIEILRALSESQSNVRIRLVQYQ